MSEIKKIVCPTDFSKSSEYAMWYARAFAKSSEAAIHCVNVFDSGSLEAGVYGVYASGGDIDTTLAKLKQESEKSLEHIINKARLLGLDADGEVRTGRPAVQIVEAADESDADLIVIATHGHTGLEHVLFGSTCERVIRLSRVPVLSIKHPEAEFDTDARESISIDLVLCPIDFSELSHQALDYATDICKKFDAKLILAHVVDTRMDYPSIAPSAVMNDTSHLMKASQEMLEKVAADIEGIEVECNVQRGIPHK